MYECFDIKLFISNEHQEFNFVVQFAIIWTYTSSLCVAVGTNIFLYCDSFCLPLFCTCTSLSFWYWILSFEYLHHCNLIHWGDQCIWFYNNVLFKSDLILTDLFIYYNFRKVQWQLYPFYLVLVWLFAYKGNHVRKKNITVCAKNDSVSELVNYI